MTDALARVRKTARAVESATAQHREALQAARDAGHSCARIAAQVGVTRQAVEKRTSGRKVASL